MSDFNHDHLSVIEHLSHCAISASVRELIHRDRLTLGLREAMRHGANVDDLSGMSGLTPDEIRRRVNTPLNVLSELDALAGCA
jgi:hypothetical protein